jgi:mannose-1-phosphate guanylyltransferase
MTTAPITPVILSGGSGTRLWPMSRPEKPKQLLALTDVRTMLQLTALRAADGDRFAAPMIVAGAAHADIIAGQLDEVGIRPSQLILEPAARNTAPAIALAALLAEPDAMLLVMPSDHVIGDVPAFRHAIDAAAPVAADGWLVTFGIAPDGPETGYGYIRVGDEIAQSVRRVDRFVEKPDLATAEAMLASGDHVWNGGIFLFRADAYLAALGEHAPAMLAACRDAVAKGKATGTLFHPDVTAFSAAPADSIDYAVMEKAVRVAVAPVQMAWSDVGSWDALHGLGPRDAVGNSLIGDIVAIDTRDCLVRSDGPVVATIGVQDLIVVATGDHVLVLPRGRSQEVKAIVDALKAREKP